LKIFITGAHGYIGRFLVDDLSERGHDVVAHGRRRPVENDFDRPIMGYAHGDLSSAPGLDSALTGCDAVIHCAARLRASKLELFHQDNVEATGRLLKLAETAGVPRFIHMSSVVVYGRHAHEGTEEDAERFADDDPYALSKIKAEDLCMRAEKTDVTVLRPGLVWGGAFDTRFTGRLVALLEKGQCLYPGPCNTPMPFTHIENLAHAVVRVLEGERHGPRAYNITDGSDNSFRDFVERLAESRGLAMPHLGIPLKLVNPLVSLVWKTAQTVGLGEQLPLNPIYLQLLNTPAVYSIERARDELGYAPVEYEHMA